MKQKGKKQILKSVALSLVICLIMAVACEFVLEYVYNKEQAQIAQQVEPFYSWSFYTPDKKRISTRKGPLELMIHPKVGYINFPDQQNEFFSINSQGFRGREVDRVKSRPRVVVVGGSAAFGTGLRGDDETFASHLSDLLGGAEVINAAVIGHRSGQELNYIVNELIDLQPDLIIALDGYNDYANRNADRWMDVNGATQVERQLNDLNGFVYGGLFTRMANVPKIPFARTLERIEQLQVRIQRRMNRGKSQEGGQAQGDPATDIDEIVPVYTTNLRKMHQIARAFSANFLCVMQPTRAWVAEHDDGTYADFRDEAMARLAQDSVAVIDLNDHAEALSKDMFMDDLHLDAQGNKVMASIVAQKIQDEGLLPDRLGALADAGN